MRPQGGTKCMKYLNKNVNNMVKDFLPNYNLLEKAYLK